MNDDSGAGAPPNPVVISLLVVIAIVLLLPGLCTVIFAGQTVATEDVMRLLKNDPYFQMILVLWAACLLISTGGIFLLRYAIRRSPLRRS